jgi:AcrR family transcriptional regulator
MTEEEINRHQLRRQRTRRQLQDAMLELVLEKGFDAIVIQEITDRADLGRGTFYFHFKSKEDVLWSIVEDRIHLTENTVMESFDGKMPEQAEYFGYLNMFRHVEQNREVYQLLISSKGSQEIANRARQYMVAETIRDIEKFGVYREIGQPPEITAQIVVGLLFSLIFWWLETPNEYSAGDMAAILYRTLHHQDPPVATSS